MLSFTCLKHSFDDFKGPTYIILLNEVKVHYDQNYLLIKADQRVII